MNVHFARDEQTSDSGSPHCVDPGAPGFHPQRLGLIAPHIQREIDADRFVLMSITKCLTGFTVLQRIERGELQLTTRVADVIPEFKALGRERIEIGHLLTHTGGLPDGALPVAGERMGDLAGLVEATLEGVPVVNAAGDVVSYSVWLGFALLAGVVRRLDGGQRPFRRIMAEDLFEPLGMSASSLDAGEPQPVSGRQEQLENLVARHIERAR